MLRDIFRKLRENALVLLALLWVFFWILPWTTWLDSLPWMRLGVSIFIFVTPGMIASLFLAGDRFTLLGHFISGLVLSIFLVGALGLIGRVFHLPFAYIKPVFALMGFIFLLMFARYFRVVKQLYKPQKASMITLVLLLSMLIFSVIVSMCGSFSGDDFSYLAYLTNWQHAQPLNFHEVIFGTGGLDNVRFWFAMFPMSLAFLSEISHLHGLLLLGFYLEPFLVIIALLSFYNLYEDILPSGNLPIAALLAQFTFLFILQGFRQPGAIFFGRLSEDKVFAAFVIAPAFFLAIRYLLESVTFKSALFALISGWGLALTHPIILTFSVLVAGFYVVFLTILSKDYKKFVIAVFLLVVVMLPSASLRFVDLPWVSHYIFGLNGPSKQPGIFDLESAKLNRVDTQTIISYIEGTPFYGFNLNRVEIYLNGWATEGSLWLNIFSDSYLWILGLIFLWSLLNIGKNDAAPFMAAAALLVLICAIPYTGWLVGYLVSARMLWRSPWIFPVGMAGVILTNEFFSFILRYEKFQLKRYFSADSATLGFVFFLSLTLVVFFSTTIYPQKWAALATLNDKKNRLQSFADLGDFLESDVKAASTFVAPRALSDYLPGISSKSKVVFFRAVGFTPYEVDAGKLKSLFFQDKSVTIPQRINFLRKYDVQYILVEDQSLKDYYAVYPDLFRAREFGGFWVIEYLKKRK